MAFLCKLGSFCVVNPLSLRDLGGKVGDWPFGNKLVSMIETSGHYVGNENFTKMFWKVRVLVVLW